VLKSVGATPAKALDAAARRNRLLGQLPEQELNTILAGASLVELQQPRVLYRDFARVPAVYFPVTAVVSLVVGAEEVSGVEIATIGNEGVAGAGAVLGVPLSFGRTLVQVSGQAVAVGARDATRLLCEQPSVSNLIRRYLYAFIREIAQAGACNRLHTVEERCARLLLLTHDRAGTDQFALTQEFLAAMMGSQRATVNLALAVLRNAGAIQYGYRTLKVLDRGELESFSCPCYSLIRKAFEVVRLDSPVANNC